MRLTSILTAAAALMCCTAASAAVLTPEAALARAGQSGKRHARAASSVVQVPVMTVESTNGDAALYVFANQGAYTKSVGGTNEGPGFTILSGDDCVPAVLGYSDTGTFDPANIPPSMKYWLDEYARQIAYARVHAPGKVNASAATKVTDKFHPIGPLCETRWNQSAPFNNMCPIDNGVHSVTGCVATALAQVMKYHAYPAKGQGSNSYYWNDSTLTMDFSTVTFDWDNMLDVYTSSATEAQKDAVAQLMYSCGVACSMNYSSNESGASSFTAASAMIRYFNYDKGILFASREYYPLDEWQELVYDQLCNYGPVQYSGQSEDGGHSFVCDGYSSDGFFHINWGWGGMSDGYFLLTALDPESQGIGGSTSGYNSGQDIIANVQAPVEGSTYYPLLIMPGGLKISVSTANVGGTVPVQTSVYSSAFGNISGAMALKCVSTTDPDVVYYCSGSKFNDLPANYGFSSFTVKLPSEMAEGTYTVTPVVLSGDKYYDCAIPMNEVRSYDMTVTGTKVRFNADNAANIIIENVDFITPFYQGKKYQVNATAKNITDSEFYGSIVGALLDSSNNLVAYGANYPIDMQPGDFVQIEYVSDFSDYAGSTAPEPGTYYFAFVDLTSGVMYTEPQEITLNADPGNTTIQASAPEIGNGATRTIDQDGPTSFNATVECTEGYFAGTVTLAIFPSTGGTSIDALVSQPLFLSTGDQAVARFSGTLSACTPGKTYLAAVFNGQTQISNMLTFTSEQTTSVDDITADSDTDCTYYTLQGVKVAGSPAPGLYVKVSANGHAGKVLIK